MTHKWDGRSHCLTYLQKCHHNFFFFHKWFSDMQQMIRRENYGQLSLSWKWHFWCLVHFIIKKKSLCWKEYSDFQTWSGNNRKSNGGFTKWPLFDLAGCLTGLLAVWSAPRCQVCLSQHRRALWPGILLKRQFPAEREGKGQRLTDRAEKNEGKGWKVAQNRGATL